MNPNYDMDWENEKDNEIDLDNDVDNNATLDLELKRREVEHDIHCWQKKKKTEIKNIFILKTQT
jgi:hypothetical protein